VPSALFANQRETNLASTVVLVEQVLADLGDGGPAPLAGALHAWELRRGSASARVALVHRAEFTHIRVSATVMTLDERVDRGALFAHLLELNAGLCGAAFASEGDHVLLVSERSTLDLDRSEVSELVRRVSTYADEHDDVLVARFGGRIGQVKTT
jgi:hypothetical protein